MFNDGKCYVWLPSYLTLSTLSADAAAAVNAVHAALGPTGFSAGDQNPYFLQIVDFAVGGGAFIRSEGNPLAWLGPIENKAFLTLDYVSLIVAFGGNVEGLPVWFRLDDPAHACPFSDSDETWETWGVFGASHQPVQIGDFWYRSSAVGQSGDLLDASDWVPHRAAGLTVLNRDEFNAVRAAVEVEP